MTGTHATSQRPCWNRQAQAQNKLKASEALSRRNLVGAEELAVHKLEAQMAALGVEEARHRHRLAQVMRTQVEALIGKRR